MNDRIGNAEVAKMFAEAANRIRLNQQSLSALDSVAGDGDHGTTMLRVAEQLEHASRQAGRTTLQALVRDTGLSILGIDGGASSALLGVFFSGMADAPFAGDSINCHELAEAASAGLRAVSRQTMAHPGDKTMMDSLVPAIDALGRAADAGKAIREALQEASSAAQAGAESTKDLVAKFGRARFRGEKTRGHADPGATSVALLFSGFSAALTKGRVDDGRS